MTAAKHREHARRSYLVRLLALGLVFVCAAVPFYQQQVPLWAWGGLACQAFLWPHLAFLRTKRQGPRAEDQHLLVDAAAVGCWLPLMGFNLVPSAALLTSLLSVTLALAGARLLLPMLMSLVLGFSLGTLLGFEALSLQSNLPVVLASLPLLVGLPLFLAILTFKQDQQLARQHLDAGDLSRAGAGAGFQSKGQWQEQVAQTFEQCRSGGLSACLVMLDIDVFRHVSDAHGHPLGELVLQKLARLLKLHLRPRDLVGRYSAEELGILLPDTGQESAALITERLRRELELGSPDGKTITCLGAASYSDELDSSQDWIAQARQRLALARHQQRRKASPQNKPASKP
ncbi:diguanylate cyclase [Gallaecimonas sp. GXIMD4217]|uniref:sensor domain-containing diguanylate cyclase n=1 Tax=Gallaecimonas sp. GXIMD4217 TaxID=3131927 RepID=UPI00311B017F